MSTVKRSISLLLAMLILVGVFSPAAQAAPIEETASVNTDNVTIEGTNGFGNLLSQEITESQEESEAADTEYPGGYSVTDLVIEGTTATVTYDTMEEAALVVALYTEDGMQMLTSTTATVTPDATEAELTFEGDMPEYFMASAYLLDAYDFSPLCAAYDTPMYTQEMQELLASTVNDYDPEMVLNLDDDETTNFAVYADSTIIIESVEGVNIVTSIDSDNATYVIKNADEQITTLVENDIFAYPYAEEEILIVKVGAISIDGTTAVITGTEISMEEAFSAVKIEGSDSTENILVDESAADDGVTYEGISDSTNSGLLSPMDNEHSAGFTHSVKFKIDDDIVTKGDSKINVEGSVEFSATFEISYYISKTRQFWDIRIEDALHGAFTITGKMEHEWRLCKASFMPIPTLNIAIEPVIKVEVSGEIEFSATLTGVMGLTYENRNGWNPINSTPIFDLDVEVEGTIFIGFDLKPKVDIAKGFLAELKLELPIGLEFEITRTGNGGTEPSGSEQSHHTCVRCLDTEVFLTAEIIAKTTFLKCVKAEANLLEIKLGLGHMYFSFDHFETGLGLCPYVTYRLTIFVTDDLLRGIPDISVAEKSGDNWGTTNEHGAVVHYVPEGQYTIQAVVNGESLSKTIDVEEAMLVTLNALHDKADGYRNIFDHDPGDSIVDYGSAIESGTCGDNLTWTLYSNGLLEISGYGAMRSYPPWRAYSPNITSVKINDGITTIGDHAFYLCTSLTSISIPDSVKSIDDYAFYRCTSLSSVIIPDSVATIGEAAFADCTSLTSVEISNSVIKIGDKTFSDCTSLTSLTIPNSVTTIGDFVFYGCTGLSSVTIPDSVTTIGIYAFYNCYSLSSVKIPDSVTTIGDYTFYNCYSLSSVKISDSVTTIGDCAFYDCNSLLSVEIPNSVTTIGDSVFSNCDNLSSVVIGNNITTISNNAFSACPSLNNVEIPDSVTYIDHNAFSRCTSLSNVTFRGNAPNIGKNVFLNVFATAYYPSGNPTWTSTRMQNYGGTITWVPYTPNKGDTINNALSKAHGQNPSFEIEAVYGGEYSSEVTDECILKTASFVDLVPGEQYVVLAMVTTEVENPLTAENLLYIDQETASENGSLCFQYIQRTPTDLSYVIACGASHKNLNNAEITFPEMVADGELQAIDPIVVYDGVTLVEDRDYVIVGTVDFTEAGEYSCSIRGIHNYTGLVECNYIVGGRVNPFSDIAPGSFYYEPVMWAIENGITNGTSATTFGPNDQCMRAHVVTFLWRTVGSPEPKLMVNPFVDVKPTDFYYKPVLWALENGITSGMDATHFGPTSYCNRAQVVTFLYKTMGNPDVAASDNPFADVAAGSFYEKPVLWAVENGITNGLSATSFGPNSICNRAQIVTFLYRAFVD